MHNINFGISGAEITINNNLLYKTSINKDRFKIQIEKQINFKDEFFKTPKVFSYTSYDNVDVCCMEYIFGVDCISYFYLSDKYNLQNIVKNIISFIDKNLQNSEYKFVDKNIFYNKLKTINIDEYFKEKISSYIEKNILESITLPIGNYHGDFTFTNMIFQNNQIYLIDFLDCFIDTPLQDIVKIRQETNFYWSILQHKQMINKNFNYNKICLCYSYMDKLIDLQFKKYDWYNKYYDLMQIFNLSRILPYNKSEYIKNKIIVKINNLLERK